MGVVSNVEVCVVCESGFKGELICVCFVSLSEMFLVFDFNIEELIGIY